MGPTDFWPDDAFNYVKGRPILWASASAIAGLFLVVRSMTDVLGEGWFARLINKPRFVIEPADVRKKQVSRKNGRETEHTSQFLLRNKKPQTVVGVEFDLFCGGRRELAPVPWALEQETNPQGRTIRRLKLGMSAEAEDHLRATVHKEFGREAPPPRHRAIAELKPMEQLGFYLPLAFIPEWVGDGKHYFVVRTVCEGVHRWSFFRIGHPGAAPCRMTVWNPRRRKLRKLANAELRKTALERVA